MHTIGAFEAKTHFSLLLNKVEQGERVIITKHGKPVARLVPINERPVISKQDAVDKIKKL